MNFFLCIAPFKSSKNYRLYGVTWGGTMDRTDRADAKEVSDVGEHAKEASIVNYNSANYLQY